MGIGSGFGTFGTFYRYGTQYGLFRCYLVLPLIQNSHDVQQLFSSERHPTLWRAIPILEELQTAWEGKRDDSRYELYREAIQDGLDKLRKYYTQFDDKPAFLLSLSKSFISNLLVFLNDISIT